jgi:hypothetical protein
MAEWKVLPHGELHELVPGMWWVRGSLPNLPLPRTMVVIRLADGLLLHSVVCLDEPGMQKLDALGPVRWIVVPNQGHRLDAPAYRERYPDAKLLCPATARPKVEQVVKVDATCEDVLPELGISCHPPAGFVPGYELVYEVPVEQGKVLVINDILANSQRYAGLGGLVLRFLGPPGGGFGRPRIVSRFFGRDRPAFKPWLEAFARRDDLVALTVSHGPPVVGADQVKASLAEAVAKL